jgi:hypothetical protein
MKKFTTVTVLFFTAVCAFAQKSSLEYTGLKHAEPFTISIKNSVLSNSSVLTIDMNEDTDSIHFELFNSKGETMEVLYEGSLTSGKHPFIYLPVTGINRPFIAVLTIATKVVSMRVVKFNSF